MVASLILIWQVILMNYDTWESLVKVFQVAQITWDMEPSSTRKPQSSARFFSKWVTEWPSGDN